MNTQNAGSKRDPGCASNIWRLIKFRLVALTTLNCAEAMEISACIVDKQIETRCSGLLKDQQICPRRSEYTENMRARMREQFIKKKDEAFCILS